MTGFRALGYSQFSVETKRVLVVDDEPEVTFALQAFFLGKGYEMMTALEGLQAMRLIRQYPVDLVILDMKMPGVNGVEVLKFIHAQSPSTKVVVVTAYDVQFQELVEQLGVDAFLIKPFGIQALTSTVGEVLAREKGREPPIAGREEPAAEAEDRIPKARLLFIEPAEYTYRLKEVFFSDPERCGGQYEVAAAYSAEEALQHVESFRPDILLVDLAMLGQTRDLLSQAMNSPAKPREIVIHGTGAVLRAGPGGGVENLSRMGVKVIQNESFTRAGLIRLSEVIRRVALAQGLHAAA